MGFFDRLFEPEGKTVEREEGGTREVPVAQETVLNYEEKVNISGSAAEDILKNALASLEGRETTIYTLQQLVSTLPTGVKKESILGVLAVTKVPMEAIQQDAQERIALLQATEKKLQEKITADTARFEAEIKEAENRIEQNRNQKAEAEALLREFQLLMSKMMYEVNCMLANIA